MCLALKPLELQSHTVSHFKPLVFNYYKPEAQSCPSLFTISNDRLKMGVFTVFDEIHGLGYLSFLIDG